MIMSLKIAYIKVPIIIDSKNSDLEDKIKRIFGDIYVGSEYGEQSIQKCALKIIEQQKIIEKIKDFNNQTNQNKEQN